MAVGMLSTRIAQVTLSTIGLLSCGLLGASIVHRTLSSYASARQWTPAPARVTRAGMTGARGAYCEVAYSYTSTDGATRRGNRATLSPGGLSLFERSACAQAAALRANGTAMCFYDPLRPDASVLFRGMRHDALLTGMALLAGGCFFFAALARSVDGLQRAREPAWRVRSREAAWPPGEVAAAAAAAAYAFVAGVAGALCLIDDDRGGLWLACAAAVAGGMCVSAGRRAAGGRFAGVLVLPRGGKGATTLCIPPKLGGNIYLRAQWGEPATRGGGEEATELRFVDVRDGGPGLTEIDILTLPPMPERVASDAKAVVYITGKIGDNVYKGSFECGGEEAPRTTPPTPSTLVVIDDSDELYKNPLPPKDF